MAMGYQEWQYGTITINFKDKCFHPRAPCRGSASSAPVWVPGWDLDSGNAWQDLWSITAGQNGGCQGLESPKDPGVQGTAPLRHLPAHSPMGLASCPWWWGEHRQQIPPGVWVKLYYKFSRSSKNGQGTWLQLNGHLLSTDSMYFFPELLDLYLAPLSILVMAPCRHLLCSVHKKEYIPVADHKQFLN